MDGGACHNGGMGTRREPSEERFSVDILCVPAPDADERLRRAYVLILRAGARSEGTKPVAQDNGAAMDLEEDTYAEG